MATKLGITRDQLSSFLQDHEQIKQFERLFSIVGEVEPASDTQGISVSADTALSLAQQVANEVDVLADTTASADAVLEARIDQVASELGKLAVAVEGLEVDPPLVPHKRARYGSFYDTTTQTAAAINTAYALTLNTDDLAGHGVYRGTPTSRVYVDTEGVYNIQFSIQLDNTSGGNHLTWIWLRINGVDVAYSASQVRLKGTDGELVAAWNFFQLLKAGDYFEIMWSVDDTAVQIVSQAAAAPVPAIPSVILTVSNNIQGVQS